MAFWTKERDKLLTDEWKEGKPALQIAGNWDGITKNAVIGRARRLKLPSRGLAQIRPKVKSESPPPVKSAPPVSPDMAKIFVVDGVRENHTPEEPIEIPVGKTVLTIEDSECRWPLGDVRSPEFHFCSHKTLPGLPYCGKHCKKAYSDFGKPKPLPIRKSRIREYA
jgi:GcrA cell cycle regulator